jgi:uncharacterized protein (UPF0276 family)
MFKHAETVKTGLAYNAYIDSLHEEQLKDFDYIEVPFELLHYDEKVFERINKKPLILHCASLSLAGYAEPSDKIKSALGRWIKETKTPWLGEHLSFILAEKLDDNLYEEYAPGEPYNIGYTVGPVMNTESVDHVIHNIYRYEKQFGVPLIVENSPLYFKAPGSTLSQVEYIQAICQNSPAELLLDLTHFYISSQNFSFDPLKVLEKLPLSRVREIHVSGVSSAGGLSWDNHASKAPEIIFRLLEMVLKNSQPSAITLEYNWASTFPWDTLKGELDKVKESVLTCV